MNIFQKIWRNYAPDILLLYCRFIFAPRTSRKSSKKVLEYYKGQQNLSSEILEGLSFLKYGKFSVQPFKWTLKYDRIDPDIRFDDIHQGYFLNYFDKMLYFKKGFTREYAQYVSRSLLREQDRRSAHVYQTPNFLVSSDSIIFSFKSFYQTLIMKKI